MPFLKVGFLFSYVAPLSFVLVMNLMKEAYDDIKRYKRDQEANLFEYTKIDREKTGPIMSMDIKAGDIIEIQAN